MMMMARADRAASHLLPEVPHDRLPEAHLPVGRAPLHLLDRLIPRLERRRRLTILGICGPARLLGHELQEPVVLLPGEEHRDGRITIPASPPELLQVVLDGGEVLPLESAVAAVCAICARPRNRQRVRTRQPQVSLSLSGEAPLSRLEERPRYHDHRTTKGEPQVQMRCCRCQRQSVRP